MKEERKMPELPSTTKRDGNGMVRITDSRFQYEFNLQSGCELSVILNETKARGSAFCQLEAVGVIGVTNFFGQVMYLLGELVNPISCGGAWGRQFWPLLCRDGCT